MDRQLRAIHVFLMRSGLISRNLVVVGAWIGDFALPWAKLVPGSVVYAIDPSPHNIGYMCEMASLNSVSNLRCLQHALSFHSEILSTDDPLEHAVFAGHSRGKNKVHGHSLDLLLDSNQIADIGFIRVDATGMELDVLKGAIWILEIQVPSVISFRSLLHSEIYDEICCFLKQRGYHVYLLDEAVQNKPIYTRDSFAFHDSVFTPDLIAKITDAIGETILIRQ